MKQPEHTENSILGEGIESTDCTAGRALASKSGHPVVRTLALLGEIGDQGPLYSIGALLSCVGMLRKDGRCFKAGIRVAASVALADVLKTVIKGQVRRTRPDPSLEDGHYEFETGGSQDKDEQSFPSGHSACSAAAAFTLSRSYPEAAPYLAGGAILISASRVLKGRHWPLDVVAGVTIGLLADRAVEAISRKL
jgi:membrane-associated phospholipid phosphatase